MGNTLPTFGILSTDDFLPALRTRCQKLAAYSTDFTALVATKGGVASVPLQSVTSASRWDSTNKYSLADETLSQVDVTLGEPIYKEFYLSPLETGNFTKEFIVPRMEAAINSVLDEVEKLAINALSQTPTVIGTVSGSLMTFAAMQSGSNVLINSGSQGQLSCFAPTAIYSIIQADAKASGYGMWDSINKGGDQFQYGDVIVRRTPKVNSSKVFFAAPDAVAIALRVPPQLNGYVRTLVADEATGVTIAVDLIEDAVGGVIRGRAHVVPGFTRARQASACNYNIA